MRKKAMKERKDRAHGHPRCSGNPYGIADCNGLQRGWPIGGRCKMHRAATGLQRAATGVCNGPLSVSCPVSGHKLWVTKSNSSLQSPLQTDLAVTGVCNGPSAHPTATKYDADAIAAEGFCAEFVTPRGPVLPDLHGRSVEMNSRIQARFALDGRRTGTARRQK